MTQEIKPGTIILDDKARKLGRVIELIGPVRAPYASVALASSRIGKAGDPVFVER